MEAARRPSGLRFLENLAYLVPGYQGYKKRDCRQDEDSRLRARVHHQLVVMLDALDTIRVRWEAEDWGAHMDHLDQRRLRLKTIAESVRYTSPSMQTFILSEHLTEQVIERILEADLLILEDLEATVSFLTAHAHSISTAPRTTKSFFKALDDDLGQLECHLITRDKIIATAT